MGRRSRSTIRVHEFSPLQFCPSADEPPIGGFNTEHDNERRSFPSIPKYMQDETLEKLILSNVSMCDWSIDELRHPIIVGVHFIKTAVSKHVFIA